MGLLANPFYILPPLVSFISLTVLIVLLLLGAKCRFSILLFCGALLSAGIWNLLILFMNASSSVSTASTLEKFALAFYALWFVLFYHFTIVFTQKKRQNPVLICVYSALAIILILSQIDIGILDIGLNEANQSIVTGPVGYVLIGINIILVGSGIFNLLKKFRESRSYDERNQTLYLSLALIFPLAGSILEVFTHIYQVATWGNLAFCLICSLAILRYHLFNISFVFRKNLIHILLSTVLALPFIIALILIFRVLFYGFNVPWWIDFIIILFFSFTLRPWFSWLQNLVDKIFYRERYDYLKALERFNLESQNIDNLAELGTNICKLVKITFHSTHVYLLLPSLKEEGLIARASDTPENMRIALIGNAGSLAKRLKNQLFISYPDDLEFVPELKYVSPLERNWLDQMDAKLIVPIKGRKDGLAGVLVLGPKLSGQVYSDEDKELLSNFTSHVGINLDNARLYIDSLRTREDLKTWLNSMSDSVIIVSPEKTIQFMNTAAKSKFNDFSGKTCWTSLGRECQCSFCPVKEISCDYPPFNQLIEVGERVFDVAYAPFIDPSGTHSIIEVLRDITERKKIEEEKIVYERKAQLASRLATVGEMAAGIAHEINNPLTAVIGYAELLGNRTDLPEDVRQDLAIIGQGAQRVANIVRRLLLFSRQSKPMRDMVNINDIIQTTLDLRSYQLMNNNIKIIKNIDKDVPMIMADGGQLQQVFLNLIANAESEMFTNHGRGVLVISVIRKDNNLRISFKDDGPGISDENKQKLFQPFFTTKPVGKGTGLGLSICHGIIAEHNGRIWAESEFGKGATFFIELPVILTAAEYRKLDIENDY